MNFFEELKRRNVYKIATAYIVVAWIVLQVGSLIFQNFGSPDWVLKTFTALVLLGFPIACLLAWIFEITPEGIKKTSEVPDGSGAGKMALAFVVLFAILISAGGYGLMQIFNEGEAPKVVQSPSDGTTSIAVLPFVNMSSDPEQEYFSDGISEELLNVLAKNKGLRVAARTSSFAFKGRNEDIREIGTLLNVGHVLEGSIRKAGNRIRVTAQLIKVDDGFHMWSETFDRELDDIFALQDEITASIYEELRLHLLNEGGPQGAIATDERAYEHYLLANELIRERDPDDLRMALKELDAALEIDPDYYPAHISKILNYTLLTNTQVTYGLMTPEEVQESVKPHIEVVERLAPNDAKFLAVRGFYEFVTNLGNEKALATLNAAVDLNPNLSEAYMWRSIVKSRMGDAEGTLEDDERAYALNPMFPLAGLNLSGVYLRNGRLEEAERIIERLLKSPEAGDYGNFGFLQTLLIVAQNEGNLPGLIKGLQDKLEETGQNFPYGFALGHAYRHIGLYAHAEYYFPTLKARSLWLKGDLEGALALSENFVVQDPENRDLLSLQSALAAELGEMERAREIANRIYTLEGQDICHEALAYTFYLLGDEEKVQNIVPYCLQDEARDRRIRPYSYVDLEYHALVHLLNKDEESALQSLNNAYDLGGNFDLTAFHPVTKLFGDNPEFLTIKAKMDARSEELRGVIRGMEQRGELTNPFIS